MTGGSARGNDGPRHRGARQPWRRQLDFKHPGAIACLVIAGLSLIFATILFSVDVTMVATRATVVHEGGQAFAEFETRNGEIQRWELPEPTDEETVAIAYSPSDPTVVGYDDWVERHSYVFPLILAAIMAIVAVEWARGAGGPDAGG